MQPERCYDLNAKRIDAFVHSPIKIVAKWMHTPTAHELEVFPYSSRLGSEAGEEE